MLVPNLVELEAIRILKEHRQHGATFRDLVKFAEDHGIRTKEGGPGSRRRSAAFLERA